MGGKRFGRPLKSKVARLFLRSAAFRCDGRKNRGLTEQVDALQVMEQFTWS